MTHANMSTSSPIEKAANLMSSSSSNASSSSSCSSSSCSNDFICTNTTKTATTTASSNLWQFVCLICVCVGCYYNSAQCGLVFDDISAIRDNKDLRGSTPLLQIFLNDFWGTPIRKEGSHKSYRPLTVLTFRFNYWLHQSSPAGYHVGNVLLHMMVCLLYRRMCRLLLQQCVGAQLTAAHMQQCSFIAALLFAVHPIHTEAVTGVVGRAELLSSCFCLLAFLIYAQAVQCKHQHLMLFSKRVTRLPATRAEHCTNWLLLLGGFTSCLLAAMLCKEQGITIAGICVAYELFVVQQLRPVYLWHLLQRLFEEQRQQRNANASPVSKADRAQGDGVLTRNLLKRVAFLLSVTVALLVGRVYVMGSQLPVFTRFDNPAAVADTPARQLTHSYLIFLNIWLLFFPCDLCCDWTMGNKI